MCSPSLQVEHNGSTVWGGDEEGTENFSNSPNLGVLSADPVLGQKREEWQQGTPSSAATIHCDRSISPHTGAFLSFSINCEVISLILHFNTLTGCSWFKLLLTKNKRYDLQCNAIWKSEPEGKNKGTWLFPQHTNSTFVLLDSFPHRMTKLYKRLLAGPQFYAAGGRWLYEISTHSTYFLSHSFLVPLLIRARCFFSCANPTST